MARQALGVWQLALLPNVLTKLTKSLPVAQLQCIDPWYVMMS
jgi:hypothetical protein